MGIQFFEEFESTSGDLLFAEEYLKEHPKENGKEFGVREVLLAKSNKGYLVKTDAFVTWLWKRSSTAILLTQALEIYVRDCYGFAIVAVLSKETKGGCKLGVNADIPCMWYGTGKKYTVDSDIPTFDVANTNPFLVQPVPLTPTTHVPMNGSLVKGKSQQTPGKTS